MCAGGSDARRWHNAWEQWVLVETGEADCHLVDYQAVDDDFTVGQMLIIKEGIMIYPEQMFLAQSEFSALFNAGRVVDNKASLQWRRFVLRKLMSQRWGRVGGVLRHLRNA